MPRKPKINEKFIYLGLDPDVHRQLRHLAADADVSVTAFMKEVVHEYLMNRGLAPEQPVQKSPGT